MENETTCECCGASLKRYKHNLSKGLLQILAKFAIEARQSGNSVHVSSALELSTTEYNNFQKLRYFGLVAKVKVDGVHKSGYWLLTRRGGMFISGNEAVSTSIITFRNKIEERSEIKKYIWEIYEETSPEYFQREFSC